MTVGELNIVQERERERERKLHTKRTPGTAWTQTADLLAVR